MTSHVEAHLGIRRQVVGSLLSLKTVDSVEGGTRVPVEVDLDSGWGYGSADDVTSG